MGYLTFNKWDKYSWDDIHYDALTHIVASFVVPTSPTDPTVIYKGTDADFALYPELKEKTFLGYLKKLTQKAHANGVKVLGGVTSSTGNNASDLASIFADDGLRAQFVNNLLDFCQANELDGLDLDYEYALSGNAGVGVSKFIADLRTAADQRPKFKNKFVISMAVGTGPWAMEHLDATLLATNCNWFNIMTYDYDASWTDRNGFNAPLYPDENAKAQGITRSVDETVRYFRDDLKVPADHLVVGLAFYGQKFDNVGALYSVKKGGTDLKYRDVATKYLNQPDWTPHWSQSAQVPYLTNNKEKSLVTYDDERSIAAKCDYVLKKNLQGVMVWELSRGFLSDVPTSQPLLDTIGKVMRK